MLAELALVAALNTPSAPAPDLSCSTRQARVLVSSITIYQFTGHTQVQTSVEIDRVFNPLDADSRKRLIEMVDLIYQKPRPERITAPDIAIRIEDNVNRLSEAWCGHSLK